MASEMPEVSGLSENKLASLLLKRKQQDYKDREYDSDDDLRKEMLTYDDRLTFVNKLDHKVFGKELTEEEEAAKAELEKQNRGSRTGQKESEGEEKQQLPIVLHEREIMENIENFMVTIVCGETGSGKSTQIP